MLMSDHQLPHALDKFLDAEMLTSDFLPERLPTQEELQEIVGSEAYQKKKPKDWEGLGWIDRIMFKLLLTVYRFWGKGDNLKKYWINQKANHANFLARKFTTKERANRSLIS